MVTERRNASKDDPRELLDRWLAEWYAPAYRTAYLILNNRAEEEDAVQDAFLRLWRFRDSIPEGDSARGWLYRVVVNACFSRARSESRAHRSQGAAPDDILLTERADRRAGPEEEASEHLQGALVRQAIATLPEALRVPLVLHYYAGLTDREIALVIHRRSGTVKSRLHEARRRLAADTDLQRSVAIEETP